MTDDELIKLLTRDDFLRELHHLLWLPPAVRRGDWDMGWNCRDHALILGFVAALFDAQCVLVQGRAIFVQGPVGEKPPVAIEQAPHAWVCLPPANYIDASVRLGEFKSQQVDWPGWPTKVIGGSGCVPPESARFIHTAQWEKYQRETAIATHHEPGRTVIYLREFAQIRLTKQVLFGAFSFCNSPMTNILRDSFGRRPDLYARAALHLFDLLNGEAKPLMEMEQLRAWELLAGRYEKPFLTVCSKAAL
jgi:hypothetical protein